MLSTWSDVQVICIWSSWSQCCIVTSYFVKTRNCLSFRCWLIQLALKRSCWTSVVNLADVWLSVTHTEYNC